MQHSFVNTKFFREFVNKAIDLGSNYKHMDRKAVGKIHAPVHLRDFVPSCLRAF